MHEERSSGFARRGDTKPAAGQHIETVSRGLFAQKRGQTFR